MPSSFARRPVAQTGRSFRARRLQDRRVDSSALHGAKLDEAGDILFLERNHYDHVNSRLETEYTFVRGAAVEKRLAAERILWRPVGA